MSLFTPTNRSRNVSVSSRSHAGERGQRIRVKRRPPAPVSLKATGGLPNEELEHLPAFPKLVVVNRTSFFDQRGLFFHVIANKDWKEKGGKRYSYRCMRYGPRAVYAKLTAEQKKEVTNARRRARKAADSGVEL